MYHHTVIYLTVYCKRYGTLRFSIRVVYLSLNWDGNSHLFLDLCVLRASVRTIFR